MLLSMLHLFGIEQKDIGTSPDRSSLWKSRNHNRHAAMKTTTPRRPRSLLFPLFSL